MHFKTPLSKLLLLVFAILSYSSFSQTEPKEEEVFIVVEQMPEYPGGTEARNKFISDSLIYPPQAIDKGVEGRVYVHFVIEKDGSISNVEVLRGIGSGCDEEAVRVVSLFPKWNPGIQKGKEVGVSYNLPIQFKLLSVLDKAPEYPGGELAMYKYIGQNIIYPSNAIENGIEGTVVVAFTVMPNGDISNIKVIRSIETSLDNEAKRLIENMPAWNPGIINEQAIKTTYKLPITFKNERKKKKKKRKRKK